MRLIDADALREVIDKTPYINIMWATLAKEDVVRAIIDAPTAVRWVCREDRLPDKDGLYLTLTVLGEDYYPQIGMWRSGEWLYCAYVHYWMPIPELPKV